MGFSLRWRASAGACAPRPAAAVQGRLTAQAVFSCLVGASTGLLMGYENGIAGGVAAFPGFQAAFFPQVATAAATAGGASVARSSPYCKYDDPRLGLFLSSVYLASVLGAIAGSFISPSLGRRATIIIAAVCFVTGAVLQGAAVHVSMLVLGRALLGLGMGAADQAGPQLVSEMAPPWLRGSLNSGFQLAIIVGFFASSCINFGTQALDPAYGWRLSLALAAVPALLLLAGAVMLHDSPSSLAERGRLTEAEAVLCQLRGAQDVSAELSQIAAAAQLAAGHRQWAALLQRRYRPQLILNVCIPVFQVLAGFQAVIFAPQLFESIGVGHVDAIKNTVIIGVVFVVFTLVAMLLADRAGRRVLFQTSGLLDMACMATLGGLLAAYNTPDPAAAASAGGSDALATAVLAVVCVYVAAFAWGWGPMAWLAPSEVTPLDARAAGTALAVISNHTACFVLSQAFMHMLCAMEWGLFVFFAGWLALATVFIQLLLPESRGVPIEAVHQALFVPHPVWGRLSNSASTTGSSAATARASKHAASEAIV